MHTTKETWHERFYLYRQTDKEGISGTGVVAEGVRWEDGTCTLRWCVPGKPRSTTTFDSVLDVMKINGHKGSTLVLWLDTTEEVARDAQPASGAETPGNADTSPASRAVA